MTSILNDIHAQTKSMIAALEAEHNRLTDEYLTATNPIMEQAKALRVALSLLEDVVTPEEAKPRTEVPLTPKPEKVATKGAGRRGAGKWGAHNPVTLEAVRDAVVALSKNLPSISPNSPQKPGTFTIRQIADQLGCSRGMLPTRFLDELVLMGVLSSEPFGAPHLHGKQYRYISPVAQNGPTAPASSEGNGSGSIAVAGTGKRTRTGDKDLNSVLDRVDRSQFEITRQGDGHIRVTNKVTKAYVTVPSTPSYAVVARLRGNLRGIGANVS